MCLDSMAGRNRAYVNDYDKMTQNKAQRGKRNMVYCGPGEPGRNRNCKYLSVTFRACGPKIIG